MYNKNDETCPYKTTTYATSITGKGVVEKEDIVRARYGVQENSRGIFCYKT